MHTNNHFIPTGIQSLDNFIGGLETGKLTFVASKPGQGKTAFLTNVVAHAAVSQHIPTAIFSIEMGRNSLYERLVAKMSKVKIELLRNGYFSREQHKRLIQPALDSLRQSPLYIDDTAAIKLEEICQRTRQLYKESSQTGVKLKLVAIDYFQLIKGAQAETNHILAQLRELAHELQIAIIISIQCKRYKGNIQPSLSDIRIPTMDTQKEDKIIFLYGDASDTTNLSVYTAEHMSNTLQIPFDKDSGHMG
ncbi:DnaB-like helicase C-terminal domain-containing protein [Candidatus Avelusimicrobium fimicolum]|uniref:DnaB-like helicase C-terminal domain-containing protein n=1 Tax=Candidatus Avelusimicrobium fimicolum TaxID=3416216 RepID=UPI003D150D4D